MKMFDSLKKKIRLILDDEPGERFVHQYERRQKERKNILSQILFVGGGLIIFVIGIIMLPAPGPGTVVIFIGLGLIGQESLYVAKFLDKVEVWLRRAYEWLKKKWDSAGLYQKILLGFLLLCMTVITLYLAYLVFWG